MCSGDVQESIKAVNSDEETGRRETGKYELQLGPRPKLFEFEHTAAALDSHYPSGIRHVHDRLRGPYKHFALFAHDGSGARKKPS